MEWFRTYHSDLDDLTIQALPAELYKFYGNLRCLGNLGAGILPQLPIIMFRCREPKAAEYLEQLKQADLIHETDSGALELSRWAKEQKPSDKTSERVKKFREKQREDALSACGNGCGNNAVTLPHRDGNALEIEVEIEKNTEKTCASGDACVPDAEPQPVPQKTPKPKTELRIQQESWFGEWWSGYWRKKDKEPAWAAFRKLITSQEAMNALQGATSRDREEMLRRPPDKRPYGATYLHKKPWLDEGEPEPVQRTDKPATSFRKDPAYQAQTETIHPDVLTPERIRELQDEAANSPIPLIRELALKRLSEMRIPEVSPWKN